eukprot:Skav231245  [mRNA]  locus=scaffold411:138181:139338:- [translate_table: standard]
MQIMKHCDMAEIHTDSAYVLHWYQQLKICDDPRIHHMQPNFDLLLEFHHLLRQGTFHLKKVKAHQDLNSLQGRDLFLAKGNAAADEVAKAFTQKFAYLASAEATGGNVSTLDDTDLLLGDKTEHWRYLVQLKRTRASIFRSIQAETLAQTQSTDFFLQWLATYGQAGSFSKMELPDKQHASFSMWGEEFAQAVWEWAALLEWPDNPDEQQFANTDVGISWVELTCNFIATVQQYPPLSMGTGRDQHFRVSTIRFPLEDNTDQSVSFVQMMSAIQAVVKFWHTATGQPIIPLKSGMVRSLRLLGAGVLVPGLMTRPRMPRADHTHADVREYVTHPEARRTFQDVPKISQLTSMISMQVPMAIEDVQFDHAKVFNSYRRHLRNRGKH